MIKKLISFLNPVSWWKASRYARSQKGFDKSKSDLELQLYSRILNGNMLHYGYFDDTEINPEDISFRLFEQAQIRYAEIILGKIQSSCESVLDVGCGMGGLTEFLLKKSYEVHALTPNQSQAVHVSNNFRNVKVHNCRYEEFESVETFDCIIHAESLQYIPMEDAINTTEKLLNDSGRWIICDYFSQRENERKKPHHLDSFLEHLTARGWTVKLQENISDNVLPTLAFVNMYLSRVLLPLKHYAFEKLRYKKPKLYFLSEELRHSINEKFLKEGRNVDPQIFKKERVYMILILERQPA